MNFVFLYLLIQSRKIWYLKFLLEGYDGLAIVSTIDSSAGIIRLTVPRCRYNELMLILGSLASELRPD